MPTVDDSTRASSGRHVGILVDDGPVWRTSAAAIWSAATAHRDGSVSVPPASESRPIIDTALREPHSVLLNAVADGASLGFAILDGGVDAATVHYLAVAPEAWGRRVATRLLDAAAHLAQQRSHTCIDLWVYSDNTRAVEVYERNGWLPTGEVRVHPRSGRQEHRRRRMLSRPVGGA
ncbi:GNAT family N-acetyltransferase [Microbacterium resistens]|uniref:GNAT family N-acetyltransferase n=1 Tax=Microbacterium resistens TaxID=156977 RepID=A0ABY3RS84_9MICO|nr:GNAT family N-acetyltransferase [Microbacterium resistens]UGS25820.1 GNAT family N-acetyltransferase [Microbacterium resistens]